MYIPDSGQNPHFDFLEIDKIPGKRKLFVFHQMKYSRSDVSTKLDLSTIQKCYTGCMNIMGDTTSYVVVVFMDGVIVGIR